MSLMNPTQARQLCAGVDMPATVSPPSETDSIHRANSADANADAHCQVAERLFKTTDSGEVLLPDFPLLPVSRGFQMKLQKLLAQFETTLTVAGITASHPNSSS